MKKKFRTFVALLLMCAIMANISISAFAVDEAGVVTQSIVVTEDSGEMYQIVCSETNTTKTTRLIDMSGNVILTLIMDIETGVLHNPVNGASIVVPPAENTLTPCKVLAAGDKDYEYEFCSLGDSYKKEYSITGSEILSMAAGAAITITLVKTIMLAQAGSVSLKDAAKKVLEEVAGLVVNKIDLGKYEFTVYYTLQYRCEEMYDYDPFYPSGGFWFLGYAVNPTYFSWRWGT